VNEFDLTRHASRVLLEREIPTEWVERMLQNPELVAPDPNDVAV
jgi:hypothetical protein